MSTLPFGGDEVEPAHPESARFVLQPVPYERTTTYRKGTACGPEALLRASAQVELFDEELRIDPLRAGVAAGSRVPPLAHLVGGDCSLQLRRVGCGVHTARRRGL